MSTEPVITDAGSNGIHPSTRRPVPGSIVRVVKAFGPGKSVELYAIVLTIAPSFPELVGSDGEPTITIAYINPKVSPGILGSGNWHTAFERVSNVAPASHADVKSGARGIYWVDVLPDPGAPIAAESFANADLTPIEGKASTVFDRLKAEDFFAGDAKTVPAKVEPVKEHGPAVQTPGAAAEAATDDPQPQTASHPSAADLDAAAQEQAASDATGSLAHPEHANSSTVTNDNENSEKPA